MYSDPDTAARFTPLVDTENFDDVYIGTTGHLSAPFTFEAWVRSSVLNGVVASEGDGTSARWSISMSGGSIAFSARNNCDVAYGPSPVNDGWWHHVAVVVRAGTDVVIFVDGVGRTTPWHTPHPVMGCGPEECPMGDYCDPDNSVMSPENQDSVGLSIGDAAGALFAPFNGDVDEVATYAYALSSSRVLEHYYAGSDGWLDSSDGRVDNFNTAAEGERTDGYGTYLDGSDGEAAPPDQTPCCSPEVRRPITDTTARPYRWVTYLEYPDGRFCTGFLVWDDTVVTSGHCVWQDNRWVVPHRVTPGRDRNVNPYGDPCGVRYARVPRRYQRAPTAAWDWGVLKLNCTVGRRTGWFVLKALNDVVGRTTILTAYHDDMPPGEQWRSIDSVRSTGTGVLHYQNEAATGSSGAPIYDRNPGCHLCAYGINSRGSSLTDNEGKRVNTDVVRNVNNVKRAP